MNYVWKLIIAALATIKPLCSAIVLSERRKFLLRRRIVSLKSNRRNLLLFRRR